jgi:ribosomal protein S17E
MGKAVSNSIKAKAKIIMTEFEDKLGIDFEKNKSFLKDMKLPLSKLTINLMAGYITRTIRKQLKEKEMIAQKMDQSKTPTKKVKDTEIHG